MSKKILIILAFAFFLTALSYFYNNAGGCCDLIFLAGWPLPFYGGSGGFMGYTKNTFFLKNLAFDLIFWTTPAILIVFVLKKISLFSFKKSRKKVVKKAKKHHSANDGKKPKNTR